MQVLVLNSGSSSLKFQLFSMPDERIICFGQIERIGFEDSIFKFNSKIESITLQTHISSHKEGLNLLIEQLLNRNSGVLHSPDEVSIIGHRVVHGGKYFSNTTEITPEVKEKINALSSLAPLHNPANLQGIEISETLFPSAKQVAVFDTAFHQSIPEHAYRYAIPKTFSDEHSIRLYGFHGTSHKYVSKKAIDFLGKEASKMITIHLGNGCSMTAIKNGKSMDHSLGFSPVSGLVMGTRSGDIDPSIIFYLAEKLKLSLAEINHLLQKESGMLGLTGLSDLRDIEKEANKGNKDCQLALRINTYRIKKYIGSYAAILNGLDAIVFTAGIGENSSLMREMICEDLGFLGIQLDKEKNSIKSEGMNVINAIHSKVKILIIPTNEELEIARQAVKLFED